MTKVNLTYSAEMMTNYLQAELISPQKKFEALQTSYGHSLLFSVSTDNVLYLTSETSGKTNTGWAKTDLSTALISKDFPGSGATCKTFYVGQSVVDESIGMAIVVATASGDQLYLCLGNSNKDLSWTESPNWVSYVYDDETKKISTLEIVNVFFCETTGSEQYIVVDIVRDPSSTVKDINRYYIDPSKANGQYWNEQDLPIDIEENDYESCIGRAKNGYVDGLYTAGKAGSSSQMVYCPVINAFGDGPPVATRLNLPDGTAASALASVRNTDLSTDLFAISGSSLYYFSSSNQQDGATAIVLVSHDIISESRDLFAMNHEGLITLWGRNASDQVYYVTCPYSQVSTPSAWSIPIPILSGIEEISPYINASNGGNTIFASGGGKLQKINQSPDSSKIWQTSKIALPVPTSAKSISFNSYTTTIQVADSKNLPSKNVQLSLKANNNCAVYINGLYYLLDSTPIQIKSNELGAITIVEATNTLNGTVFTVSDESGVSVVINPMDKPFKKLAELGNNSGDTTKLTQATFKNTSGNTVSLVAANTSTSDLKTLALGLSNLKGAYNTMHTASRVSAAHAQVLLSSMPQHLSAADSIGDDLVLAAGDLFNWLESGVEAVISIVKDAATNVWHFIATIGGKVYRAILSTVKAIVGAVEWVFKAVKTVVEDVIRFVEFLFEWDDIKRTKEVLHNLTKLFLEKQVSDIETVKHDFDTLIGDVEATVSDWAGITDWSDIGAPAAAPASGSSTNPMQGQTSGSQHLSYHFQNNAQNITILSGAPAPSLLESLIDDLFTAMKQEATVLDGSIKQLENLAKEFSSLSVEEVLKKLIAILVDGVLSSCQVVIDAMLNIIMDVASSAIRILDAKIHIPIISDILNDIGIPDLSFLDLFCWINGAAFTIVYKIAEGMTPFPDDANSTFLINATSMAQLQSAFTPSHAGDAMVSGVMAAPNSSVSASGPVIMSQSVQDTVFITGHSIASFCTLMGTIVSTFEAAEETGDNPFSIPSAVLGVLAGGSVGLTNFLVPKDPIKNTAVSAISTGTTGIRILCKVIFSDVLQDKFKAASGVMSVLAAEDGRATGAIVDSILVIPALACTGFHFYELSQDAASKIRTDAILEEVSNLTSYVSRVAYAFAVNDKDPETKAIEIGIMDTGNVCYSGLQMAEAVVN